MTSQTITKHDQFLTYVQTVQKLRMDNIEVDDGKVREAAVDLAPSASLDAFVQGELAFLRGDYKASIEHFLQTQGTTHYHYFCYRSSAFVSHQLGRKKKALAFLAKALRIFPQDDQCLELLIELSDNTEQVKSARLALEAVREGQSLTEAPFSEDDVSIVGIADEEMNELTHLFDEEPEERHSMQDDISTTTTKTLDSASQAIDALKELADSNYEVETTSTERFITDHLVPANSLEHRIHSYRRRQVETMSAYAKQAAERIDKDEQFLLVLNGWQYAQSEDRTLNETLLPARYRHTTGGYFLRWNNKGIVINPGPNFLKNFHSKGLHITDIDAVVVTQDREEAYQDVHAIYDLTYHLNKMDSKLHIIHYYLNQQTHRRMASSLKPHFKQEKNTVHSLDLYVDSPDVESVDIAEGIVLHYFPTTKAEQSSRVGLRLELTRTSLAGTAMAQERQVNIAYLSGTAYSPLLGEHISGSDVIIAGFEDTDTDDYNKLKYNRDSLGYFGTSTLIQETHPKLLISAEYSGRDGDIRVEVVKKLRQEWAYSENQNTMILPGDTGLCLDLEEYRVRCNVTGTLVDPMQIQVVKSEDAFGHLRYLSPCCVV